MLRILVSDAVEPYGPARAQTESADTPAGTRSPRNAPSAVNNFAPVTRLIGAAELDPEPAPAPPPPSPPVGGVAVGTGVGVGVGAPGTAVGVGANAVAVGAIAVAVAVGTGTRVGRVNIDVGVARSADLVGVAVGLVLGGVGVAVALVLDGVGVGNLKSGVGSLPGPLVGGSRNGEIGVRITIAGNVGIRRGTGVETIRNSGIGGGTRSGGAGGS